MISGNEREWLIKHYCKKLIAKKGESKLLKKFVINLRIEPQHLTKIKKSKPSYNSKQSGKNLCKRKLQNN